MAFSDFLKKLIPSPTTEEGLMDIPALLGAYESARGKPIGTVLSGLAGIGNQNAQTRQSTGNRNVLQQMLGNISPTQAPVTYQAYQNMQPYLSQMSPDMANSELGSLQGDEVREELANEKKKAPNWQHIVTKDGQLLQYDPNAHKYYDANGKEIDKLNQAQNQVNTPYKGFAAGEAARGVSPSSPEYNRDYNNWLRQGAESRRESSGEKAQDAAARSLAVFGVRANQPISDITPNVRVYDSRLRDVTDTATHNAIRASSKTDNPLHAVNLDTAKQIQGAQVLYSVLNEAKKQAGVLAKTGGVTTGVKRLIQNYFDPGKYAPLDLQSRLGTEGVIKFITKNRPPNDQINRVLNSLNNPKFSSKDFDNSVNTIQNFLTSQMRDLAGKNDGASDLGNALWATPAGTEENITPAGTPAPAPDDSDTGDSDETDDSEGKGEY